MKKVLILEDEATISEFVEINLKRSGYQTIVAATGEEALKIVSEDKDIDIALLDIMLPGIDGFEVCRKIREMGRNMGIIMLSAKSQEMDKVTGLMIGADDYVPKPFSVTELVARVDSLYRRLHTGSSDEEASERKQEDVITSGIFKLDLRSRALYKNGVPIELTQVEFVIMKYFMQNPNKAISREEMLNAVRGNEYFGDSKIVDVNLRRLTLKVEDNPAEPRYLVAVWAYGYKWVV